MNVITSNTKMLSYGGLPRQGRRHFQAGIVPVGRRNEGLPGHLAMAAFNREEVKNPRTSRSLTFSRRSLRNCSGVFVGGLGGGMAQPTMVANVQLTWAQ
ncbi:MAG: hypothetical protein ACOZFS_05350 [Thermodesulfobacteriota bacterium]